ncbi:MAG TPA: hypothetical protein VNJ03_01435 [Vicinamibacterales bacterium]|nr:hypothetical protein [Vicinamibacterales bacterium]
MKAKTPTGLSPWAAGVWVALHERDDFAPHEDVAFERALRWFDVADRLLLEAADDAHGLKASQDAALTGLRFWRTLKFPSAGVARRPGRPAGDAWNKERALQAAAAGRR